MSVVSKCEDDSQAVRESTNSDVTIAVINLLASTILPAVIVWLWNHPDIMRRMRMRAALTVKRQCYVYSDALRSVADKAGTYYNAARNTTV